MNRLLSFFKRRPTTPTLFPTARLASSLTSQSDMSPSLHPHSASTSRETYGNFDLIKRVKLNFSEITVSSWRSRVTGLSVVHLDYDGEPRVSLPFMCIRVYSADSSHREWLFRRGH